MRFPCVFASLLYSIDIRLFNKFVLLRFVFRKKQRKRVMMIWDSACLTRYSVLVCNGSFTNSGIVINSRFLYFIFPVFEILYLGLNLTKFCFKSLLAQHKLNCHYCLQEF